MNIVVIVTYFVGHVKLSLLINDFILYAAIVKCIKLIAVKRLYISIIKWPNVIIYYIATDQIRPSHTTESDSGLGHLRPRGI